MAETGVSGVSGPAATAVRSGCGTAASGTPLPPRLRRALESQRTWADRGVHLVPIRHHSPACALALSALLEQVRPGAVLIEGPAEYTALLPALQDPATVPPIAVLSLADRTASYYPLAEFSPEWVALRWAGEHAAEVAFIDRNPRAHDGSRGTSATAAGGSAARTLQAEYHLARSTTLDSLARRLGCRDHDEVWEQLFEDRDTSDIRAWQGFFADTLAWAALARLDAEREVLDADSTHAREAVMAAALRERLPDADGSGSGAPIVVVTGAFHTLALLDALDGTPEAAWLPEPEVRSDGESWLIRYDFARLDSLRGYGAGMPSPGLWQRAWRVRTSQSSGKAGAPAGPRGFATAVILDVVNALRETGEPLGTAQVRTAVEQALGLAALRGRAWPGRTDLLDALTSCLVKDDTGLSGNLGAAVAAVFAASDLGRVPAGTASPPLVAEVRARLRALRFALDDAAERRVSLDTARKPRHRERRELLARLRFARVGLARQVGGADLVAGTGLGQFVEEWAYAWTPMVEASLVRAAQEAPTVDILVRLRLAERLSGEIGAAALAGILTELALMGMDEAAEQVCDALEAALTDLSDLGELAEVLHRLVALVEGSGRLRLDRARPRLRIMLRRGTAAVARLVAELAGLADDEAAEAVDALIAVRDLLVRLARADDSDGADDSDALGASGTAEVVDPGREAVLREIDALRRARATAPMLAGCATGIAATIGSLTRQEVTDAVVARLSHGADPAVLADFLVGLVRTSPDVILRAPDTLRTITRVLTGLDESGFLAVLPDLRRAFTALRPTETHRLAEQIASLTGADAARIDVVWNVDSSQAAVGRQVERDLVASLVRDGLEEWVGR